MKKVSAIIIICILLVQLAGCSNGVGIYANAFDVARLQLIMAIGVDREPDGLVLTVASGQAPEEGESVLMSRKAPSIAAAMRQMEDYASSEELFYSHARYLLLGEAAARKGTGEYLGFVERSTDMRVGMLLTVVRGGTAKDLMTGSGDDSYNIAKAISSIEHDGKVRGNVHVFTCGETARALADCGAALVCAVRPASTEGTVYSVDAGTTCVPDGFGVLKAGALVGWLDTDEALAACLLMGYSGPVAIVLPDGEGGEVTLILESGAVKVRPRWDGDGSLQCLECRAELSGGLLEMSAPHDVDNGAFRALLGRELAETVCGLLRSVLAKEKALGADFLGLWKDVRAADPGKFDALESWTEAVKNADYEVTAEGSVGRSYKLNNSIAKDGSGEFSVAGK